MNNASVTAQTPVLVGCAAIQQHTTDLQQSREAMVLMQDAVLAAAQDCGNSAILSRVQRIYVPKGLWSYSDPARLIARAIGAPQAHTVLADFGILQQTLIGDACERIANGEIECALIVGGEAKFRQLQAQIQGATATEIAQDDKPDTLLVPDTEMCLDAEANAGLLMPVGFYALIESALRFARGETLEAHRDRLACLYQRMSEIAADNPQAWKREPVAAEQIRNAVGKNRLLAFPYTKLHNSEWNVDQASALLLCSQALADELGIAAAQRVYPLASTESNHVLCVSQRAELHRATGAELSLQAALQHAQLQKTDIDLLELYSCFPAAVQVFANALGCDDARDITVTGGMPFAGGPLNNYVLQATCRMIELLRAGRGQRGLVSSVSGMLNKQAWGLWSTVPGGNGFAFIDVSDEVAAQAQAKTVLDDYNGSAVIAAYTVLYQGDAPSRAIAIVDTPAGERCVVCSEAPELLQALLGEEYCGKTVQVTGARFCSETAG